MKYHLKSGEPFCIETPTDDQFRSIARLGDDAMYVGSGQHADCADAEAMATSCFLCEACRNNRGGIVIARGTLASMRRCDVFIAAMTLGSTPKFLGCVAADRKPCGRLYAHSLCVIHTAQGNRIGTLLLSHLRRYEASYDLKVVKPDSADTRDFVQRQAGLMTFYRNLGFAQYDEDDAAYYMRC